MQCLLDTDKFLTSRQNAPGDIPTSCSALDEGDCTERRSTLPADCRRVGNRVATYVLKPGDRLPPQRQLALQLQVDLAAVIRACDAARRRHLLEGRGARGTWVAAPKVAFTAVLDLSMKNPPLPDGVDFDDLLRQGLKQVLMRADNALLTTYHVGGGRQAGAAWTAPRFGGVDPGHIVVCPGAQAAIAALILALNQPGDLILAEPTSYPGLRVAATQCGRRVMAVDADADGMTPAGMAQACRVHEARLVYLNPALQNPAAATMPETRRMELGATAQR